MSDYFSMIVKEESYIKNLVPSRDLNKKRERGDNTKKDAPLVSLLV